QGVERGVAQFDVFDVYRFAHPRDDHDAPQIGRQVGAIDHAPQVALEQTVIGGVEADQGYEQPDVGFGQTISKHERPAIETLLQLIDHFEHAPEPFFVTLLRAPTS